jgi:hypothetical protein
MREKYNKKRLRACGKKWKGKNKRGTNEIR